MLPVGRDIVLGSQFISCTAHRLSSFPSASLGPGRIVIRHPTPTNFRQCLDYLVTREPDPRYWFGLRRFGNYIENFFHFQRCRESRCKLGGHIEDGFPTLDPHAIDIDRW